MLFLYDIGSTLFKEEKTSRDSKWHFHAITLLFAKW